MHLQRRLSFAAAELLPLAWPHRSRARIFSGSISQLGHSSRAAAASPRSAAAHGGTETCRPTVVPTVGLPDSDSRGDVSPSGHLCTRFEVQMLLGYVALSPAAWPCCPRWWQRQECEQEGAALLHRRCHLLGSCKEQGKGDPGASAGGPCHQGLVNSETSLH